MSPEPVAQSTASAVACDPSSQVEHARTRALAALERWLGRQGRSLTSVNEHSNFNHVFVFEAPGLRYFIKVALDSPKRLSGVSLPAQRIESEARALRLARSHTDCLVVPEALYLDTEASVLVMSDVGQGRLPLVRLLEANYSSWLTVVEPLSRGLAQLHASSRGANALCSEPLDAAVRSFVYEQLLSPGITTLAGALAKPVLAQMAGVRECLIHSDVWPKNILAGANPPALLDFEGAMPGDPAFDLASVLGAQLLPVAQRGVSPAAFETVSARTLSGYRAGLEDERWFSDLRKRLIPYLAVFLACRIAGPFAYDIPLRGVRALRQLVLEISSGALTRVDELYGRLAALCVPTARLDQSGGFRL